MRRVLVLVAVMLSGGCSLSPATGFGLLHGGDTLTRDAKNVRQGSAALPRELDSVTLKDYLLAPGDGLILVPANLDSPARLPVDQTVLPDGSIDLGQYGILEAAGKTTMQVEIEVNGVVAAKTPGAGFIDVRLVRRESKVYYVLGAVNNPGSFPFTGRETVLDALVAAGWLTDAASHKDIILARPTPAEECRIVLSVCVDDIVQLGDTTTNYRLLPGDRVYVAAAGFCDHAHSKKKDPNCARPQFACPLPGGGCAPVTP